MSQEVIVLKLSTGEEIIARLEKRVIENDTLVLDRPRVVHLVPSNDQGQMGITLVPFIASDREGREIKVNGAHVVAEAEANDELRNGYLSSTSGIALG